MRAQLAAGAVPAAEVEFVILALCGESRVSMGAWCELIPVVGILGSGSLALVAQPVTLLM